MNAPITADDITNAVIQRHPKTVAVFAKYGADSCCGGTNSIEKISEVHAIDLDTLLAELNAVT